jgi:molybdenum cofactor cytidylyltransferase
MIRAVILAAGRSERMGQPKAGLPVADGGPTFAAAIVTTLQSAGIDEVIIVAGAHLEAVTAAVQGLTGVRVLHHPGWPAGQLSSLVAGLDAADTPELAALLVTLVDIPRVRGATVAALVQAWRTSRAPIVRPAVGTCHGHPVIFDRVTFADLRAAPLDVGAKAVIAAWRDRVLDVPTDDVGVLLDVDTPHEYDAFRRQGA